MQATGRVPTEPTGWERRHSTVLPALGAPSDFWAPRLQTQLVQMVVWLLQRRLLVQLHTYVCLMAAPSEDEPRPREDDAPLAARVGGRSLSTPNALSFGSPSRTSCPWHLSGEGGGWAPGRPRERRAAGRPDGRL